MDAMYRPLFAQMISLARITDGNEHLITPDSTALLRHCLARTAASAADIPDLSEKIVAQKRSMVPDCFRCANPCGKTFPFDFRQLEEGECGSLKLQILDALCAKPDLEEGLLYRSLTVVSLDGYTPEELTDLLREIQLSREPS